MTKIQDKKLPIFIIAGPTASGKTALAAELIQQYPFEIISADSRQVYRQLNIGTGKDKSLPQHMIDVVDPEQKFSVAHYSKLAMPILDQIHERGHIPLVVGGTGYYIEALMYAQTTNDTPPSAELRARLESLTNAQLLDRIFEVDPATASTIDSENRVRLIRALEIIRLTNAPREQSKPVLRSNLDVHLFLLNVPRSELYKRIDERVDARLKAGMVEEVQGLIKAGVAHEWLMSLGLEYRFIIEYLLSKLSYEEMVTRLKFAIHAYARRQLTFFRRWKTAEWCSAEQIKAKIANSGVN